MKLAFITLLLAFPLLAKAQNIPTPEMAITVAFGDDKKEWAMQFTRGNETKIIAEFTPKGQKIEAWQEMVAQEISFTDQKLGDHLAVWKKMVSTADPHIDLKEEKDASGSITVTYKSKAFNEFSIRRFMQGNDGVYALAYHMKLNLLDKDRVALWKGIVAKAKLIPNPAMKKAPAKKE